MSPVALQVTIRKQIGIANPVNCQCLINDALTTTPSLNCTQYRVGIHVFITRKCDDKGRSSWVSATNYSIYIRVVGKSHFLRPLRIYVLDIFKRLKKELSRSAKSPPLPSLISRTIGTWLAYLAVCLYTQSAASIFLLNHYRPYWLTAC